MSHSSKEKNRGFTLIEIIISISLLSLLAGLSLVMSFEDFRAYSFFSDKNLLVGLLQKARGQSVNNIDDQSHGVYINRQLGQYTLFEGAGFEARDPAKDVTFPQNGSYSLSGLNEVVFNRLSGSASSTGSVVMDSSTQAPAVITINGEGRIDQN